MDLKLVIRNDYVSGGVQVGGFEPLTEEFIAVESPSQAAFLGNGNGRVI